MMAKVLTKRFHTTTSALWSRSTSDVLIRRVLHTTREIHFVTRVLPDARMRKPVMHLGRVTILGFRPEPINRCSIVCENPAAVTAGVHTSTSRCSNKVTDFLRRHRQGLRDAPSPAQFWGFSGLIPLVAPAVYTAATFTIGPDLLWAQAAYGAVILSFIGGLRWGFALTADGGNPSWSALGYSVMPPLVAWSALLMPLQPSQICVMLGLLMSLAADMGPSAYPPWFRSLRLVLSLLAVISIGTAYGFCLVLEPTSEKHGSNVFKLIKIVKIILEE